MPSNPHVDGRTNGAALRPLSPLQIKTLIALARKAFAHLCDKGALSDSAEFNAWRHQQCLQTVERGGLRECRNEDFLPLKAHFLRLQVREEEATSCLERHEVEPRTWAMRQLQQACTAAADVMPRAMDYAYGFVKNKRHVMMVDADATTLRHAAYVVARKAAQLRSQSNAPREAGAVAPSLHADVGAEIGKE